MLNLRRNYIDSFRGLRREIWYLAIITFINRAGTMVIPFLSLYLTKDKGFSLSEVGSIMSAFGFGSVIGSWLGGKLTTKWGFYPVMLWSLIFSSIGFVLIQFISSFYGLCVGVFLLIIVTDTFRPAVYVSINAYSKPENQTRSVTLIRLAINLGFSFGPALGGIIIAGLGYGGLFWVDGVTCLLAAFIFLALLNRKASSEQKDDIQLGAKKSPYKDYPYLLFIFIIFLIGVAFLQFFSTIPLYYDEVYGLSETEIGLLMALNGGLIFILEMPLIKKLESPNYSAYNILIFSMVLFALSFLVLNLFDGMGILILSMLFVTFGEMLNFPFINNLALKRSEGKNMGDYMALFSISFAVAHIVAHKSGMELIKHFGYDTTWYVMTGCIIVGLFLFLWLKKIKL